MMLDADGGGVIDVADVADVLSERLQRSVS